ncbi:hypothetical protein OKW49_005786 [Paraburkholderia youngii]|uniref:hypothetical protein n=1 Tax=Paraburkholderia youngii TaxID=2782701 RepID=UPI003D1AF8FF
MQVAESRLVECELTVLDDHQQTFRALGEIEDLFLVGDFPSANRDAIEKRLNLGKRKRVPFEHTCIPDEFRQHAMKTETHPFDRMDRNVLWNRSAIPLKTEFSEKRHRRC